MINADVKVSVVVEVTTPDVSFDTEDDDGTAVQLTDAVAAAEAAVAALVASNPDAAVKPGSRVRVSFSGVSEPVELVREEGGEWNWPPAL